MADRPLLRDERVTAPGRMPPRPGALYLGTLLAADLDRLVCQRHKRRIMQDDGFFGASEDWDDDEPALALGQLARLAGLIRRIDWFGRAGTPMDRATADYARHYLETLGFPDIHVAELEDWPDAANAAHSLDFDNPAWDSEEQLRASLTQAALDRHGEDALAAALDAIAAIAAEVGLQAAQDLGDRMGIDDEGFLQAAVGAVVQACHQAGLVLLAGEDNVDMAPEGIPFAWRFRLFEAGRWPLGIAGSSFNIF